MSDSLQPARYNLDLWEGASFRKTIVLLSGGVGSAAQNLTGYTSVLTVRAAPLGTILYTLSTQNNQIILGGTLGTIQLFIPATDTLNQAFFPLSGGVYELLITAPGPGDTSALMWGNVQIRGIAG